jgi:hypothetical protein
LNFCLWNEKNWEFESEKGKGRPSKKDAWSVAKIDITSNMAKSVIYPP